MNEEFLEKQKLLTRKLKRRLKGAKRGVEKVASQLEEAYQWQEREREAVVLQSNLYQIPKKAKSAAFVDWESGRTIEYAFRKEPHEEAARLYKSAKKLRAGIEPLEKQLEKAANYQEKIESGLACLEQAETVEDLDAVEVEYGLKPKPRKLNKPEAAPLPYREALSSKGIPIWIGKSAKDNDRLTFTYARGSDTWLHVDGYSGSHVVIRSPDPDEETVQEAANLAVKHSRARNAGKVEVIVTQVKYVSRFKSSKPGAVHVSKRRSVLSAG